MFKAMPVEQLIKVFNEYVTDTLAFRFPCIYEMDDEENWNRMNQFYGVLNIVNLISHGTKANVFSHNDKYWLFEEDANRIYSFSTTEGLLEITGTDAFVDTFYNMEYEYKFAKERTNAFGGLTSTNATSSLLRPALSYL